MSEPLARVIARNARLIVPLAIVQTTAYWLLNHHPIRPSARLPLTALDEAIPFLPWTAWPYLLLMFAAPALPLFIHSRQVMLRLLFAYGLSVPPAFLVFLLFPTSYPRPDSTLSPSPLNWAYSRLMGMDTPECCFPSGHILVPVLAVWGAWLDRWRCRWLVFAAFILTAPTILTTKQHYVWDLLGGIGFAVVGILLASVTAGRTQRPA